MTDFTQAIQGVTVSSGIPWSIILPVVGVIAAPIGAYFLAARRMSGRVATSDASELWEESRSIRDDLRERLETADKRVLDLEARVATLEGRNGELQMENLTLRSEVASLERTVAHLNGIVAELNGTITKLDATIASKNQQILEAGGDP